jgi:acetoin utilization deacetylase AcuC-like enzyme
MTLFKNSDIKTDMKPLKIFTHPDFTKHDTGHDHPECAGRIIAINQMVEDKFSDFIERPYPADESKILLAHPQSYADMILDSIPFDGLYALDGDTVLSPQSYDIALLAIGASCMAVDAVISGESQTAFAAIRPPGHHAEYNKAMGFCLFNNAFIAARHSGVRTLIIDFDVHHGNGTEDLVKRHVRNGHNDIAYASIHQNFWPYTGHENSANICNVLLVEGAGSQEFQNAITNKIKPFVEQFKPELIIFSAGFDAHQSDPLGGLNLAHDDFAWIVHQFKTLCPKMVSILEGGYNLETLPTSVYHHLKALSEQP